MDLPLSNRDLLLGVGVPAAVAGAVWVAGRWVSRRGGRGQAEWVGPVGVCAGFVVGYLALFGPDGFPPRRAFDWLLYLAPMFALAGLFRPKRGSAGALVVPVLAVCAFGAWKLYGPLVGGAAEAAWYVAVPAALMAGVALVVGPLAERAPVATPLLLLAWAGTAGAVVSMSGSLRMAQVAGAVVGATLGVVIAAAAMREGMSRGTAVVVALLGTAGVLNGRLWAVPGLEPLNVALLLLAPASAWLGQLRVFGPLKGWKRVVVHLLPALVLLGTAALLAAVAFWREQAADPYGYY